MAGALYTPPLKLTLIPRCRDLVLSFLKVISKPLFSAKADEEPVDPKKYLEDGCKPKCVKQLRSYEACIKRIQGDESGHKHCTGQYFDYWSCVDKCVAPTLFLKLK
ncbi:hypothetical protein V6N13_117170 [Hibiscus sabdariffa]|uniref:Uncharacterized protein n=2 Tax=Hibiscus sabdariffa TaxID=183260 RepID=A0ABR2PA58_9ROSI